MKHQTISLVPAPVVFLIPISLYRVEILAMVRFIKFAEEITRTRMARKIAPYRYILLEVSAQSNL